MYKINAYRKNGELRNSATFETIEKLNEWKEMCLEKNKFGLPERTVLADGNYDLADVIEEIPEVSETLTRSITIFDEEEQCEVTSLESYKNVITPAMVKLKAEYTIEVLDITEQVNQQKVNQEAQKFLSDTDYKVVRHYEEILRNAVPHLSVEEFDILLIERQQCRDKIVK